MSVVAVSLVAETPRRETRNRRIRGSKADFFVRKLMEQNRCREWQEKQTS
jgi:hypothetical protein